MRYLDKNCDMNPVRFYKKKFSNTKSAYLIEYKFELIGHVVRQKHDNSWTVIVFGMFVAKRTNASTDPVIIHGFKTREYAVEHALHHVLHY